MAFNAGSIEATLDLNRNPFTQGLRAARAEANRWSRNAIKADIKPELSSAGLTRVREQLSRVVGRAMINPRLDQGRMRAVKAQIERQVGNITVRPRLDQAAMRALRERINNSVGRILVKPRLDWDAFRRLQERIRAANAYISVSLRLDRDSLTELRARLRAMTFRSNLRLDVDRDLSLADLAKMLAQIDDGFRRTTRSADRFGDTSSGAFQRADGAMRVFIGTMPLALSTIGALVQAAVGLGGALVSTFVTAGAGVGAFALVAVPVFKKITEGAKKTREEIAKLPSGIREGANALKTLQEEYGKLVERTQDNVGLALAAGFDAATAAIKTLDPIINAVSTALVNIGRDIQRYFGTEHWATLVDFLSANVGPTFTKLWDIVKNLTRGVLELVVAFNPLAQWLLDAIVVGMQSFAQWASTLANNPEFVQWLESVKDSLTSVWNFIKEVVIFLFRLANALAPVGRVVMDMLTGVFEALNKMPPEWLAAIAGGLSAIMAALLFGASPGVAAVIGVIAGVAFALTSLYDSSEKVRGAIDPIVNTLRDIFLPVFQRLSDLFQQKVVPAFKNIGDTIINDLLPAFDDFLQAAGPFIAFFTENVGVLAITALEKLLQIVDYTLKEISSALRFWGAIFRGDWGAAWDEIQTSFGLKMDLVKTLFGDMWQSIKTTLAEEGEIIKTNWNSFWDGAQQKWDSFKTTVLESWHGFWAGLLDGLGLNGDAIVLGWQEKWNQMWVAVSEKWEQIKAGWNAFWIYVGGLLSSEGQKVVDLWNQFWDFVWRKAEEIWNSIKTGWNNFWGQFRGTQDTNQSGVSQSWGDWFRGLGETIGGWIRDQIDAWNGFWTDLGNTVNDWVGRIQGAWDSFLNGLRDTASRIWGDIQGAFNDGIGQVKSAVNGMIDTVNKVFDFFNIPGIPKLAKGGKIAYEVIPEFAAGAQLFDKIGGGFRTTGPRAIVGEGNPNYPEYVIPTDPQYRDRALNLYNSLGSDLSMMATGGILGTGLPSLNFPSLPSLDSVLGAMTSVASGHWLGVAQGIARKIWDGVTAKVNGAIQAALAAVANAIGSLGGGGPVVASGNVMEQVRAVAARYGWGGGAQWNALVRLIQKESSWNPNAANPTSSARGLFQKMTSIHGPVEGTAAGQAVWGLNYIAGRYGSPAAALAFHNRNNWYDNGGILPPGLTMAFNGTGKNEAVLTEEQWKALAGRPTTVVESQTPPGAPSLEKLNSTMESVKDLLEKRGAGATVNINGAGQSAPEVARAAVLQLRLN